MKVGNVYCIKTLSYAERKPESDCQTVYEYLGLTVVTVTEVNDKGFKTDYSDEIYKSVPELWISDLEVVFTNIAYTILRHPHAYSNRVKSAFFLLSEEDKMKVGSIIAKIIKEDMDKVYRRSVKICNEYLDESAKDIIQKYIKEGK